MIFNIPNDIKYKSGIYVIRNIIDDRIYIGRAGTFHDRYITHKNYLSTGKSKNKKLQEFVNIHGIDKLIFEMCEIVDDYREVLLKEKYWILKTNCMNTGFNGKTIVKTSLDISTFLV